MKLPKSTSPEIYPRTEGDQMAELAAGGLREALDNPHFVGAMRHAPKTDTAGTRVKPFHGHTEADTEAARKADEAWRRTEAR